ncbi:MAG: dTDP-4-dehydrorhamnose 3,5-epimerase family protein [Deltaproteobacteria bacterium]|nr:dTDP-4-dehydrorhamnose 3,5-epimerase family protein [Deltaproteobacteria bacterium]
MSSPLTDLSSLENKIVDVVIKPLKTHADDRGFFREIIRNTDDIFCGPFAQWSHSKMAVNTVKAWHYHHIQYDWWYIAMGQAHIVLYDLRVESSTFGQKLEFDLGDTDYGQDVLSAVVRIPPGVAHACKALVNNTHLLYVTSETYNPNDEGRYPYNDKLFDHNWGNEEELIVVENDKRAFKPTGKRTILASR